MQTKKETRKHRRDFFDTVDLFSLICSVSILIGFIVGFIVGIICIEPTLGLLLNIGGVLGIAVVGMMLGSAFAIVIIVLYECISIIKDCFKTRG